MVRLLLLNILGYRNTRRGDERHLRISELSKRAQGLVKRYYEGKELDAGEKLKDVEEEVD